MSLLVHLVQTVEEEHCLFFCYCPLASIFEIQELLQRAALFLKLFVIFREKTTDKTYSVFLNPLSCVVRKPIRL